MGLETIRGTECIFRLGKRWMLPRSGRFLRTWACSGVRTGTKRGCFGISGMISSSSILGGIAWSGGQCFLLSCSRRCDHLLSPLSLRTAKPSLAMAALTSALFTDSQTCTIALSSVFNPCIVLVNSSSIKSTLSNLSSCLRSLCSHTTQPPPHPPSSNHLQQTPSYASPPSPTATACTSAIPRSISIQLTS